MLLNQFLSVSFIEKAGDFTDDVGNLQPGNRISCKTGGVKRSEKKQDKAGCRIKKLLENNAHFADLFNAAVFQGEQVLKPEDLKEADTDVSSVLKFNGHAETDFVSSDEFLSNFKKTDRLHPVISLCVYYGEEKWDGPGCLKDMLKIPEKLQSLVSDYSMNLLQVRTSKPMQFRNPDVNTVFEASRFIYEKDYENLNAIYENKEIPSELGLVIGTITNSQSLIDRALEAEEKEGGQMIMCKALEELRMEGVLQGRTEGIRATVKTCKKFQINKEAIIETIGKEFSMPEKEVAEYVEKYW